MEKVHEYDASKESEYRAHVASSLAPPPSLGNSGQSRHHILVAGVVSQMLCVLACVLQWTGGSTSRSSDGSGAGAGAGAGGCTDSIDSSAYSDLVRKTQINKAKHTRPRLAKGETRLGFLDKRRFGIVNGVIESMQVHMICAHVM